MALLQADLVAALLKHAVPGIEVHKVVVHARGDLLGDVPLDRIGGQGIFVKEVQAAVLEERADAAVHSAKDLPPVDLDALVIACVPRRGDPRDALVGASLRNLRTGAVVATGSARRRAQLANIRSDLTFVELRGNMGTRLSKVTDGSVDAVVAAAVALERLGWSGAPVEVQPSSVLLPQVGQGALAVECRRDDESVSSLLETLEHRASRRALDAERSFLRAIGGSCSLPVGAYAEVAGDDGPIRLEGLLASADGRVVIRTAAAGDEADVLGSAVAGRVLDDCGGSSIEGVSAGGRAR